MSTTAHRRTSISKTISVIDLAGEYRALKKKIDAAVARVLAGGHYILGAEVKAFEADLAAYCGVREAIGVNSGTDAILIALKALDIGPGDEVIVPAMSFIASAEPIAQLGARPVFVDIDPRTYTLDPEQTAGRVNSRTKAIMAVHLYGQPARMDALEEIAQKHNLALIEDMAQAMGSAWRGKNAGGLGKIACLSFYPTKNLGAYGDAGMILTSDAELARRARRLHNHGAESKYEHLELGYNSRLDEIQAAILRVKLPFLDVWNGVRIQLAGEYDRLLSGLPVRLPYAAPNAKHVYHLYTICTPQRDALAAYLLERGIQSAVHYPKPLHLQKAFQSLGCRLGDFPEAERLSQETLSLPLHSQMTRQDVRRVADAIQTFFKTKGSS